MLKAILFDIDNTLILFDELLFFKEYMPVVAALFEDIIPRQDFSEKFIRATLKMMKNDGGKSNRELFWDHLSEGFDIQQAEFRARFDHFYRNDFTRFQSLVTLPKGTERAFSYIMKRNIKIVAASNPVWPEIVQRERLSWAGLHEYTYALITHIDNMSYCKPNIGYYREICGMIDEAPEHCLMVGNDPLNDMSASLCGMKTYLTIDSKDIPGFSTSSERKKRDKGREYPQPDFTGTISEVPDIVHMLLNQQKPCLKSDQNY